MAAWPAGAPAEEGGECKQIVQEFNILRPTRLEADGYDAAATTPKKRDKQPLPWPPCRQTGQTGMRNGPNGGMKRAILQSQTAVWKRPEHQQKAP